MRWLLVVLIILGLGAGRAPKARAGEVLGIHVLHPGELPKAARLLKTDKNKDLWQYVTIPLALEDVKKQEEWQQFFDQAKELRLRPMVRLVTKFENGAWRAPTRKDIVDLISFLERLQWPDPDQQIVIVMNEPNHRAEWGGQIDPEGYADILAFAADWMRTSKQQFVVLPAGMDLAAPNGPTTMDAFVYLARALRAHPELLEKLDGWTSHSYPNPAFMGKATDTGRASIRGYQHELKFLARYTKKELPVYITETGWVDARTTARWLSAYYEYAAVNVWSDPRVKAVTPFLLQGAPGPFENFSFYDADGRPTRHFEAYRRIIEKQDRVFFR